MQIKLSALPFGERAVVREIRTSAHDLNCLGLRIGKELKMITKHCCGLAWNGDGGI